jgi:hypothetical protein
MTRRQRGYELVDRRWAAERISEWLSAGSGTLVVTGGAGTGKTTLLTALAASGSHALPAGRFHAVHLCRGHILASTDPIRVLSSVARRLARSVPGYATALRRLGRGRLGPDDDGQFAARLVLGKPTPAAAYEAALRVPFETLAARRSWHQRPQISWRAAGGGPGGDRRGGHRLLPVRRRGAQAGRGHRSASGGRATARTRRALRPRWPTVAHPTPCPGAHCACSRAPGTRACRPTRSQPCCASNPPRSARSWTAAAPC